VANKLYSLSFITEQIEEFAKDRLFSVVSDDCDKVSAYSKEIYFCSCVCIYIWFM